MIRHGPARAAAAAGAGIDRFTGDQLTLFERRGRMPPEGDSTLFYLLGGSSGDMDLSVNGQFLSACGQAREIVVLFIHIPPKEIGTFPA